MIKKKNELHATCCHVEKHRLGVGNGLGVTRERCGLPRRLMVLGGYAEGLSGTARFENWGNRGRLTRGRTASILHQL